MQNAYCDVAKGSKEAKIQRDRKSLNINSPKKLKIAQKLAKMQKKTKKYAIFLKLYKKQKISQL